MSYFNGLRVPCSCLSSSSKGVGIGMKDSLRHERARWGVAASFALVLSLDSATQRATWSAPFRELNPGLATLDQALTWLGLIPSAGEMMSGQHGGWCTSPECMKVPFHIHVIDGNLYIGHFCLLTYILSVCAACVFCHLGMWHTEFWCRTLFTRFDSSRISIPSELPWPDPPGQSSAFDVPVHKADEVLLVRFLEFRRVPVPVQVPAQREAAAREAVSYMAELWENKVNAWCHAHYVLRQRGLVFPYRAPFMNPWGFWGETSTWLRSVGCGQITFACEHFAVGVFLPALYCMTGNDRFFYAALHADMAVETYDLLAIAWRALTGSDHTVSRYHPSIDKVLVPHHLFTVGFELMGLMAGAAVSKTFVLQMFVSAHFTGGLIYLAVCIHQSPALSWRRFLYSFQAVVLASIYLCRVVIWLPIAVASMRLAYLYASEFPAHVGLQGQGLGYEYPLLSPIFVGTASLCAFYTYFNIDMVQYHTKLLQKAAARL